MKIRTEPGTNKEPEIIVRYRDMTPELDEILTYLHGKTTQLKGKIGQETFLIQPGDIYYFESVENVVYAYGTEDVYQTGYTLAEVEKLLARTGFFRCNKSLIVNLDKIVSLSGVMGNKIDARLKNGEHIIISRHYAKDFRACLREGAKWRN